MNLRSHLYYRYNGFMLGVIYMVNALPLEESRYPIHRRRMTEFLDEIGVSIAFPEAREAFAQNHNEIGEPLGLQMAQTSRELVDFFLLGMMAVNVVAHRLHVDRLQESEQAVRFLLKQYGFKDSVADNFLRSVGEQFEHHPEILHVGTFLTMANGLLVSLIRPLRPEPRTCFVALPFSEPFATYYSQFYRPLLHKLGFRSIRAWDGVGSEYYLESLRALIQKSGLVLADLSDSDGRGGANENVLIEIGLARGLGRRLFLVGQVGEFHVPSNIDGDVLGEYAPSGDDWPDKSIEDCHFAFRVQEAALAVNAPVVRTMLKYGKSPTDLQ